MSTFDEEAATWDDDPARAERAAVAADAIRAAVPLSPTTRLLDFGAGTGLLSQALAADVGSITLADASAGMRQVMHAKIAAGTLPGTARVWDLDLSTGGVPAERFDVIVTVMTLHHIPSLAPVLDGFAALLADGGHLCVVDLYEEDGSFHDGDFDGHHGFDPGDLTERLEAAGFADVRVRRLYDMVKGEATYPLFLTTCTRSG